MSRREGGYLSPGWDVSTRAREDIPDSRSPGRKLREVCGFACAEDSGRERGLRQFRVAAMGLGYLSALRLVNEGMVWKKRLIWKVYLLEDQMDGDKVEKKML